MKNPAGMPPNEPVMEPATEMGPPSNEGPPTAPALGAIPATGVGLVRNELVRLEAAPAMLWGVPLVAMADFEVPAAVDVTAVAVATTLLL